MPRAPCRREGKTKRRARRKDSSGAVASDSSGAGGGHGGNALDSHGLRADAHSPRRRKAPRPSISGWQLHPGSPGVKPSTIGHPRQYASPDKAERSAGQRRQESTAASLRSSRPPTKLKPFSGRLAHPRLVRRPSSVVSCYYWPRRIPSTVADSLPPSCPPSRNLFHEEHLAPHGSMKVEMTGSTASPSDSTARMRPS